MALLTEKGTGRGSQVANVTIRGWIVLIVTLVGCFNSTLLIAFNCWAAYKGITVNIVFEPVLSNVLCIVIGWYFGNNAKQQGTPPPSSTPSSNESRPD